MKNNIKLGCYTPCAGTLEESAIWAYNKGANCMMIYTGSPQSITRRSISTFQAGQGKDMYFNRLLMTDLVIHAPYIINLATDDETKRANTYNLLLEEMNRASELGAEYLIVHAGNHLKLSMDEAFNNMANIITCILRETCDLNPMPYFCIEMMSGKGTEMCTKLWQVKKLFDMIPIGLQQYLGVCIDTCHMHDAGYNMSDIDGLVKEIEETVGMNKIKVIHLNGSLNPQGSRKDRHANIGDMGDNPNTKGKDFIGLDTLKKICQHEAFQDIPKILETPWIDDKPLYTQEITTLLCE